MNQRSYTREPQPGYPAAEKYKPAIQRKGNEADRQENGKSTSHVTAAFPVNNNTCVQEIINWYLI